MDQTTFKIVLYILAGFEAIMLAGALTLLVMNNEVPTWMSTAIIAVITGILGLAVHRVPDTPQEQEPGNTPPS